MNLMQQITTDVAQITTAEFSTSIVFTAPNNTTATIKGIGVKHHLKFDEYGAPISSKTTRISISEGILSATGYAVRNGSKEVSLIGHRVSWTDVQGNNWTYKIKINIPGETVGSIGCNLEDYVATGVKKISGYQPFAFVVNIVASNPTGTKTLDNGDVIPAQYVLNNDGTLTIPYLAGLNVLLPFMIDGDTYDNEAFNKTTGTFDNSVNGGFDGCRVIGINAAIPYYY